MPQCKVNHHNWWQHASPSSRRSSFQSTVTYGRAPGAKYGLFIGDVGDEGIGTGWGGQKLPYYELDGDWLALPTPTQWSPAAQQEPVINQVNTELGNGSGIPPEGTTPPVIEERGDDVRIPFDFSCPLMMRSYDCATVDQTETIARALNDLKYQPHDCELPAFDTVLLVPSCGVSGGECTDQPKSAIFNSPRFPNRRFSGLISR